MSGCVVGNYSRMELIPTGSMTTEVQTIQTEANITLASLGFLPFQLGKPQPTGFVADWMLHGESLSQTNCIAEWVREHHNFWLHTEYSVQMFVQGSAITFVILTDESGSQSEVKKIEIELAKLVEDKFPNLAIHVIFHRIITAEEP